MLQPLVLPKQSKAAKRTAKRKAKQAASVPLPKPDPLPRTVAIEVLASALLQWPKIKQTEIDMTQVSNLLEQCGKPTDPQSHDYSAGGRSLQVPDFICLLCHNTYPLEVGTVWNSQGGYLPNCPACIEAPEHWHIQSAIGSVWLPSQLSHFPTEFQYAVRERVLDRIAAS